jgi:hypothetical protein
MDQAEIGLEYYWKGTDIKAKPEEDYEGRRRKGSSDGMQIAGRLLLAQLPESVIVSFSIVCFAFGASIMVDGFMQEDPTASTLPEASTYYYAGSARDGATRRFGSISGRDWLILHPRGVAVDRKRSRSNERRPSETLSTLDMIQSSRERRAAKFNIVHARALDPPPRGEIVGDVDVSHGLSHKDQEAPHVLTPIAARKS